MNALELILGLGRWGQTHRTEMLTGLIGLPLLLGGARLILGARQAATTTHGSARWATPREVRQVGLYGRQGVILGRLGGRLLGDASDTHVLLVAPTRSGKGVGIIIPTLLSWPASAHHSRPQGRRELRRDGALAGTGRREPGGLLYAMPHAAYLYQRAGHDPRGAAERGGRHAGDCAQSGGPGEDGAGVGHQSALPGAGGPGADGEYAACEVHGPWRLPGAGVGLPDAAAPHLAGVPEDLTDDGAPHGRGAPGHCHPHDGAQ